MEDEVLLGTGAAVAAEVAVSALAGHKHCANCGAALTGRFCASCGQAADSHRRSVGHLLRDLVKDIASFDSRILRTAVALLLKPGELAKAFREGRTQRYVPPVRLYLFVSLIFFLVMEISGVALMQFVTQFSPSKFVNEQAFNIEVKGEHSKASPAKYSQNYYFNSEVVFFQREGAVHAKMTSDAQQRLTESLEKKFAQARAANVGIISKTVPATLLKLAKDPAALNGALTAWMPRALFLLLPLFALILTAFYWRQRKNLFFVDHLVFSLGFHTFGFVLLLVTAGLAQLIAGETALLIMSAVAALYLFLAMKRFYGQSWRWTGAKWAAVLFIYTVFCVFPAVGGVIAASVLWG